MSLLPCQNHLWNPLRLLFNGDQALFCEW